MKIAIVGEISKPISKNSYGGTETWTYNLIEELSKRGHKITLFSIKESKISGKLEPVCSRNDLISYKEKDFSKTKITLYVINQLLEVYKRASDFDLIHMSIFSFFYTLPFAHNLSKPVIITVHGYKDMIAKDMKKIFSKFSHPHFVFPAKAFIKNWPLPKHYSVIPHGIKTSDFNPTKKPLDYYLWIGRICEEKGVEDAIEFAERTHNNLVIAGAIDSRSYFKEKIKPHLSNKIRYVGVLTNGQKAIHYRKAKALLFTSLIKEAFGLVITEALASGTPVIAYNVDPVKELILDKKTGFVVKKGSIDRLIKAAKKIEAIDRVKCREDALKRFSIEVMADAYEKLYKELINGK